MNEKSVCRVFGLAKGKKNLSRDFNGEIVTVDTVKARTVTFYFEGSEYKANSKQFEPVELLFPNTIYVSDGTLSGLDPQSEEVTVNEGRVANHYARRGSHWIRYFIDPEELMLSGEEGEDKAHEQALKSGSIIVNAEKLKSLIKEKFPEATEKDIQEIMEKI